MGHYGIHGLLDAVPDLSTADKDGILYKNAEKLLGISIAELTPAN
jgi:predicted TIM-barrel fold metal-dependent hydrolase